MKGLGWSKGIVVVVCSFVNLLFVCLFVCFYFTSSLNFLHVIILDQIIRLDYCVLQVAKVGKL